MRDMENLWSINVAQREPDVPLESVKMSRHKMWFDASKAVRELGLRAGTDRKRARASREVVPGTRLCLVPHQHQSW